MRGGVVSPLHSSLSISSHVVKLFLATTDIFDDSKLLFEADGRFESDISHTFMATLDGAQILSPPITDGDSYLTLELRTDLYPGEISYQLRMVREQDSAAETSTTSQHLEVDGKDELVFFRPPRYFEEYVNTVVTERIPIPEIPQDSTRQFVLIMTDQFGDGLCCTWSGDRSTGYTLFIGDPSNGNVLVESKFEMTAREVQGFTLGNTNALNDNGGVDDLEFTPEQVVEVKVTITLDSYPDETGFFIEDVSRRRVVDVPPGTYSQRDQLVEETVTLEPGLYTFTILDAFGDGLTRADGLYKLALAVAEDNTVGRPPLVSGNGAFTSRESQTFLVEGEAARYPLTILLPANSNPSDYGFSIYRLDLPESDASVGICPMGSCPFDNEQFSETLMVTEGALYRIVLELSGEESDIDDIRVILGSEAQNDFDAIEHTITRTQGSESSHRWQVKVLAGDLAIPVDETEGDSLTLRMTFDRFPGEIEWVLLWDDQDDAQESRTVGTVIAYGPPGLYSGDLENQVYEETVVIPKQRNDQNYVLVVTDSGQDGLCCSFGSGGPIEAYHGTPSDGSLLFTDPFQEEDRLVAAFTLPGSAAAPSRPASIHIWLAFPTLLATIAILDFI